MAGYWERVPHVPMLARRFGLVALVLLVGGAALWFVRLIPDRGTVADEHASSAPMGGNRSVGDTLVSEAEQLERTGARKEPVAPKAVSDGFDFHLSILLIDSTAYRFHDDIGLHLSGPNDERVEAEFDHDRWRFAKGLHAGQWTVDAHAAGFRPLHWSFELEASEPSRTITLLLLTPRQIAIQLRTPLGDNLLEMLDQRDIASPIVVGCRASPSDTGALEPPVAALDALPGLLATAGWMSPYSELHKCANLPCERVLDLDAMWDGAKWEFSPQSERGQASARNPFGNDARGRRRYPDVEGSKDWPVRVSVFEGMDLLGTQQAEAGTELLSFRLTLGRVTQSLFNVSLIAVDARSGASLSGALVSLGDTDEISNAAGRVVLPMQSGGCRKLKITCADHALVEGQVTLPLQGPCDLGRRPLEPVAKLRVHVESKEDIRVWAVRDEESLPFESPAGFIDAHRKREERRRGVGDDDFDFSELAAGRYILHAEAFHVDYSARCTEAVAVELQANEVREVRLAVVATSDAHITGAEHLPNGTKIIVRDARHTRIDQQLAPCEDWTLRLPAGEYAIELELANASAREIPLHVGTDGARVDIGH